MKIIPLACFAQLAATEYSFSQKIKKYKYENISTAEDSLGRIIVMENNVYKQNGVGIGYFLQQIDTASFNRVIVLNNNVPQLLISKNNGEWEASYELGDSWKTVRRKKQKNSSLYKVDIVIYPELYFRNIKLHKIYDVAVNLSPAIEVSLWKGMMLTAQVIFPIVNQYGANYGKIRPGFVTISQDFRLPDNWFIQATGGLFSRGRLGVDLKAMHIFRNERFAVKGQIGLTGPYSFYDRVLHYSIPRRLTWSVGGQYYYPQYNLQFNLDAIRYIGKDYGVRADMTRHFKNVSIALFAEKSNKGGLGAGFNFAIALPPYSQNRRGYVRVRTADHFFLEYNGMNEAFYRSTYKTNPGENRAGNNFNPYFIEATYKKMY